MEEGKKNNVKTTKIGVKFKNIGVVQFNADIHNAIHFQVQPCLAMRLGGRWEVNEVGGGGGHQSNLAHINVKSIVFGVIQMNAD